MLFCQEVTQTWADKAVKVIADKVSLVKEEALAQHEVQIMQ